MIKQVLSGSASLTAALSAGCFGAISGGGEKVELTFKQKWCALTASCCLFFSFGFLAIFYNSQAAVPHIFNLKEQTRVTQAVITIHKISI